MKNIVLLISLVMLSTGTTWLTNIDEAKKEAKERKAKILMVFSGSDWCKPCIQLKETVFESEDFKAVQSDYVLLSVDFKRDNSSFTKEQIAHNEALAEKYNSKGIFPLVLILNEEGVVEKSIEGYSGETAKYFVSTYL